MGDLQLDSKGIAVRGLLVRHLLLPGGVAGTQKVMQELRAISPIMAVNLLDQYMPLYKAQSFPEISRRVIQKEFEDAREQARGLTLILD